MALTDEREHLTPNPELQHSDLEEAPIKLSDSLFEELSSDGQELASINFHLLKSHNPKDHRTIRLAESTHYRTKAYGCQNFWKPISRCLTIKKVSSEHGDKKE